MRIAGIIPGVASSGGAERVMCALCSALAQRGHEVFLISQEPEGEPAYPLDPRVTRLDTGGMPDHIPGVRTVRHCMNLRRLLCEKQIDAAVSFITIMNVQALLAANGTGVPMVVSERVHPALYKGSLIGFLRTLTYPLAAAFVFQTQEAQSFFSKKIRRRGCVIPNPLPSSLPRKTDYSPTHRWIAVGRLTPQKNYPLLLRAFAKIRARYPGEVLEIYGTGEEQSTLEALTVQLGIADAVRFMGVCCDLHERMCIADGFLMTSDFEGMSNALAEAMAIGLPCAVTNCAGGGAAELIQDGGNRPFGAARAGRNV